MRQVIWMLFGLVAGLVLSGAMGLAQSTYNDTVGSILG